MKNFFLILIIILPLTITANVFINSTGQASVDNNSILEIPGNWTNSGIFNGSDSTKIHVTGNWVTTGTFNAINCAVYFKGSSSSTITTSSGDTFILFRIRNHGFLRLLEH